MHPTGRLDFVFYPPAGQEACDGFADGSGVIQLACRKVSMAANWCRDQSGVVRARTCKLCLLLPQLQAVEPRGIVFSHTEDGGSEAQLRKLLTSDTE